MGKITVYYSPIIDEEEKKILSDAFRQDVDFCKFEKKGVHAGAYDVEILINIFGGIVASVLYDLIKNLFKRNRKNIMDGYKRPRYTVLVLRKETEWIVISNVNPENKMTISITSANSVDPSKIDIQYSDEELSKHL